MIDVETIFDSDREEYEFMQEKKAQPMNNKTECVLPNEFSYVVRYCVLCDKTIETSKYFVGAVRGECCEDCKALWKKIKEGSTDEKRQYI